MNFGLCPRKQKCFSIYSFGRSKWREFIRQISDKKNRQNGWLHPHQIDLIFILNYTIMKNQNELFWYDYNFTIHKIIYLKYWNTRFINQVAIDCFPCFSVMIHSRENIWYHNGERKLSFEILLLIIWNQTYLDSFRL